MKISAAIVITLVFSAFHTFGQFPIKIPKINIPKVETPKPEQPVSPVENSIPEKNTVNARRGLGRNLVMDDAATFFDAEPVKEYDAKIRLQKDIGWYLKSSLRLIGTFPNRSAFRIAVKKNGRELSTVRCEGIVYTKEGDHNLKTAMLRKGRDLSYEDFMTSGLRCFDEKAVIKETGPLDVDVFFINGDTDAETLVRQYKIDVHRAAKVRGSASAPQPDVADYYIQRHAEAAAAFAYFIAHNSDDGNYYTKPIDNFGTPGYKQMYISTTYSPAEQTRMPSNPFVRCSVNGQRINLPSDKARVFEDQTRREMGIYTDRNGAQFKSGSPYKDWVEFVGLTFQLPLYTDEGEYAKPPIKLADHPGKWECAVIENGQTYRTFRWTIENGEVAMHPEQKNGNINLFHRAALIEMEIPQGGSPIDFRLVPMPTAGIFYGIPWSTAEGKSLAARVPKLGTPYHVPSK